MTDPRAVVDWAVADRVATTVIAGVPGRGRPLDPVYTRDAIDRTCVEALAASAAYSGLGEVRSPPRPELVDRRQWTRAALVTLARATAPLERRIAADLELPGPLGSIARRTLGAIVGTEAGIAAGYAGRRVLGQYDVSLFGGERPARLLFVAENMESTRRELGADPEPFLRWIALHECTHVVQFERVPWLADHLRRLIGELLDGAAESITGASLATMARALTRDPRQLVRAMLRGELARVLASAEQRALLDRVQATMSVVEGHAEHVMDACARDRDPRVAELRERLEVRRARRGGLGEIVGRLLGIDLKLRQYELGKTFFDRIVSAAGEPAAQLPWGSPADLPTLAELEHPSSWLERVGPVPAAF